MNAVVRLETAPTIAHEINEAHQLAQQHHWTGVRHAIHAGELLIAQKARLEHGEFGEWVKRHCKFSYASARAYMQAAEQNARGASISSLRSLFPSGRRAQPAPAPRERKELSTQEERHALGRLLASGCYLGNKPATERAFAGSWITIEENLAQLQRFFEENADRAGGMCGWQQALNAVHVIGCSVTDVRDRIDRHLRGTVPRKWLVERSAPGADRVVERT